MLLDSDALWSLSSKHLKLLKLLEVCKKASLVLIEKKIKSITIKEHLTDLIKSKFINYRDNYYYLTVSGYDALAIHSLKKEGLNQMGEKIGMGKESDIYIGKYNSKEVILKFHRLGRNSFKTVKKNRNYFQNRNILENIGNKEILESSEINGEEAARISADDVKSMKASGKGKKSSKSWTDQNHEKNNWFEISKVSAKREYDYLTLFQDLNVPKIYALNRHVCIMERMVGYVSLYKYNTLGCLSIDTKREEDEFSEEYTEDVISDEILTEDIARKFDIDTIYNQLCDFIVILYKIGYVHGDLNEFNCMINERNNLIVLDFPQCVKTSEKEALDYLKRDFECVKAFFYKKFRYISERNVLNELEIK